MAIYTAVTDRDVSRRLLQYDIGKLNVLKGITGGVQNSNYFLSTSKGSFILTLYEQMVKEKDLPFYLNLMERLADAGVNCPQPIKMKNGKILSRLRGRPAAIVSFLNGASLSSPLEEHCRQLGQMLARMHLIARDFPLSLENTLSNTQWRNFYEKSGGRAGEILEELPGIVEKELDYLENNWPVRLPTGIIHADLFPDNVLFLDNMISGLIDFYFSANDLLAFDVAICINAWCFEGKKRFSRQKSKALLEGYQSVRKFESAEIESLPVLCRGASMRFLITRIHDWLNVPPDALMIPHDPLEYLNYLRFHQTVSSLREYGIESWQGKEFVTNNNRVQIWTDGACSGNPGPGGWGVLLQMGKHQRELQGGESETTNNRMELRAVIEALNALRYECFVDLYTDSQYVRDGITGWIHNWKRKGWRTSAGKPVKNVELWQELERAISGHKVTWHWVKGHAGIEQNEKVDELARLGMEPFKIYGKSDTSDDCRLV